MSLAIIEQEGSGKQRIYYEGARADKVLIKSILRNEVIINAGRGDQRLTMLHGQAPGSERAPQQAERGQFVPQQKAESSQRLPGRHRTLRLDRQEVAGALSDLNKVMQEVSLSPVTSLDRTAGFRITDIRPGSILSKMGLQNGAVIKAVDEETITNPEQVAKFLQRVREGGQVTVTVSKRRRTQHIHLEIQ
jgi:general secretion pathway protein C